MLSQGPSAQLARPQRPNIMLLSSPLLSSPHRFGGAFNLLSLNTSVHGNVS